MTSVGETLRQERLRQGLDIEKIASETRINVRYLEAIEADDVDSLPGNFFYRSFVRQYARYLGLEEDLFEPDLARMIEAERAAPPPLLTPGHDPYAVPPLPSIGRSSTPNRLPFFLVLLVTVTVACSAFYALWQQSHGEISSKPSDTGGSSIASPPPGVPVTAEAASSQPETRQSNPNPGEETSPTNTTPSASEGAAVSTPAPAQPSTSTPYDPSQGMVLEVKAIEDTWLSITADGNQVIKRLLTAGESRRIQANEQITMVTGNAGGVQVIANGQPLETIGPRGQVRVVDVTRSGVNVRRMQRRQVEEQQEQPQAQQPLAQ